MCARSLTCKSHSMGAKRAVPGRSLPYDMLLAAYQKKNQAKQQSMPPITLFSSCLTAVLIRTPEAALDANAPVEDEDDANNGPVDSDEETALVMSSLAKWKPQPVIPQPVFTPIRRQYQLSRLHEQMQMATNGGRTNIFAVKGFGARNNAATTGNMPDPATMAMAMPQPPLSATSNSMMMTDGEDAPGEDDMTMGLGVTSGLPSGMGTTHRQTPVPSHG